ncbi:uncharacterized protein LOC144580722 [Callithrix jacchus]
MAPPPPPPRAARREADPTPLSPAPHARSLGRRLQQPLQTQHGDGAGSATLPQPPALKSRRGGGRGGSGGGAEHAGRARPRPRETWQVAGGSRLLGGFGSPVSAYLPGLRRQSWGSVRGISGTC